MSLENILEALCKLETTSGKEFLLLDFLVKKLEEANFKVNLEKVFEKSYNITALRGKGGIWFVTHMDVYPNFELAKFKKEKNQFYGRGVIDVKGQIAALLDSINKTSKSVQISFVVDEELGGRGSENIKVPPNIIGCIVLEPTNFKLGIAQAGSLTLDLGFRGDSAHGSVPWRGESAIDKAMECYINFKKSSLFKYSHPLFERGFWVNLGTIWGGFDTMIVAPYCKMSMEIGFAPGISVDQVINFVYEYFNKADHIYIVDMSDPWEISPTEKVVKRLIESYEKVVGKKMEFCGMPAWTDGSNIIQKGVPTVIFGAGDLALAHTSKEKIDITSLKTLSNTLTNLIEASF